MNWLAIRAIVRKDLRTIVRNRGVRIPLIVTPVILLVILPLVLVGGGEFLATASEIPQGSSAPFEELSDRAATHGGEGRDGQPLSPQGRWATFVLEVFLAPLYLLIPLIVATVIAADSFAGERERGTLEALLHSATTDRELLTAKFLASWLPSVTVSTVGFVVYAALANVLAWPHLGRVFFPTLTWWLLAGLVAPGIAALGLAVMVIASSRVNSLQAAHQIGSLVVIPMLVLLVAQITGVLLFNTPLVIVMGVMVWALAGLLLTLGGATLRRHRLALKL